MSRNAIFIYLFIQLIIECLPKAEYSKFSEILRLRLKHKSDLALKEVPVSCMSFKKCRLDG